MQEKEDMTYIWNDDDETLPASDCCLLDDRAVCKVLQSGRTQFIVSTSSVIKDNCDFSVSSPELDADMPSPEFSIRDFDILNAGTVCQMEINSTLDTDYNDQLGLDFSVPVRRRLHSSEDMDPTCSSTGSSTEGNLDLDDSNPENPLWFNVFLGRQLSLNEDPDIQFPCTSPLEAHSCQNECIAVNTDAKDMTPLVKDNPVTEYLNTTVSDSFRLPEEVLCPTNVEPNLAPGKAQNISDIQSNSILSSVSSIILTEEEKKTLILEGCQLPSKFPLSRQQEFDLKKVRRKIKNKLSAQESRRKKKEYVERLEEEVDHLKKAGHELKSKLGKREQENTSLYEKIRRLEKMLHLPDSKSTVLSVFFLSFILIISSPFQTKEFSSLSQFSFHISTALPPFLQPFLSMKTQSFVGNSKPTSPDLFCSREDSNPYITAKGKSRVLLSISEDLTSTEDLMDQQVSYFPNDHVTELTSDSFHLADGKSSGIYSSVLLDNASNISLDVIIEKELQGSGNTVYIH